MLAGELYDPFDPELAAAREQARDLCQALNATPEAEQDERRRLLRRTLRVRRRRRVWIQPPFFCDYGGNIPLGERVFFNFNCVVLDVLPVTIGDYTLFGPAVQIYTATAPDERRAAAGPEFGEADRDRLRRLGGGAAIICPACHRLALRHRRRQRGHARRARRASSPPATRAA